MKIAGYRHKYTGVKEVFDVVSYDPQNIRERTKTIRKLVDLVVESSGWTFDMTAHSVWRHAEAAQLHCPKRSKHGGTTALLVQVGKYLRLSSVSHCCRSCHLQSGGFSPLKQPALFLPSSDEEMPCMQSVFSISIQLSRVMSPSEWAVNRCFLATSHSSRCCPA